MSKYIALPYTADHKSPSVPLRDLVDTPDDYRDKAFATAFHMIFDSIDVDDVIIESGAKSKFGDFTARSKDKSVFMFFTEVLSHEAC